MDSHRSFPAQTAFLMILGLVLCLGSIVAQAATLQVPAQYTTVRSALNAASAGDTVLVAPGTYAPSTTGEIFPLSLSTGGVQLIGAGIGLSILDAEGTNRVLQHQLDLSGIRVSGFTITGGVTTLNGGGLLIQYGTPEIDHNLFLANSAIQQGSGIAIRNSAMPYIHHNVVWESFTVAMSAGDPHGVQYSQTSGGLIEHNLIGRSDSNGLFLSGETYPEVRHNILFENGTPPDVRGRGVCALASDIVHIYHNLFYGNVIADLFIRVEGNLMNLTAQEANDISPDDDVFGNLSGDPLLTDPENLVFSLQVTSPAIDAGDPSLPGDPDGTILDIGPYFFDQTTSAVPGLDIGLRIMGNVPNPFNPATEIRYRLEHAGTVSVRVLDARGGLVQTLLVENHDIGDFSVRWNGTDNAGQTVASGLYLAVVQQGSQLVSAPMLLIR
ncbi:MAG: FlgD immunoglobulin-like domain containing protein [bacterium]